MPGLQRAELRIRSRVPGGTSRREKRAIPGGYAITGQKLWTSRAHWSQWCLLLARTDPTAKRHRGISCFVIETSTPGVSPRSITQITGDRRFAEVFFDGAFVPENQRIGPENGGWQLALTTLAFERGPADIGQVGRLRRRLRELDALLAKSPEDAEARAKVERCHLMVEVLRLQVLSSLSKRLISDRPSSEGSLDKLLMAQTDQLLAHTKMDLLGSSPLLGEQLSRSLRVLLVEGRHNLRRHRPDPAEHRRRARPRPPPSAPTQLTGC